MLNEVENTRVRAAVEKAEVGLTVEIVPCVFAQSSPYPETTWAGAAAAASIACGGLFLADRMGLLWVPLSTAILFVPVAAFLGAVLGHWCRPVKRMLLGPHRMKESTQRRAKEVFFDRGIARTKMRDGILIFASLLEKRVVILADEEVRDKIPAEKWKPLIDAFTKSAAEGRIADGLIAAVEKAGAILNAAGLAGKSGGEGLGSFKGSAR